MCTKVILTDGVLLNMFVLYTALNWFLLQFVINLHLFLQSLVFTLIVHWTGSSPSLSLSTQGRDVPAPGDPLQTNKVVPLVCLVHQRESGIEETK